MRKVVFFFPFFPPNHSVFLTNSERVTKQEKVTNPEETAMCEEVMSLSQ